MMIFNEGRSDSLALVLWMRIEKWIAIDSIEFLFVHSQVCMPLSLAHLFIQIMHCSLYLFALCDIMLVTLLFKMIWWSILRFFFLLLLKKKLNNLRMALILC